MDERITCERDLETAAQALARADSRLERPLAAVGPLPLRLMPAGLEGLLRIVVGQQLSVASAKAVWAKVEGEFPDLNADDIAQAHETRFRAAGLSRQKTRTFRAVAEAVCAGLDLTNLVDEDAPAASEKLVAISGVGPWTAELYLMFCAGHPDILPVGDLAVRRGARSALGLDSEPGAADLAEIGLSWSPHRSTAARLFWAHYKLPRPEECAGRVEDAANEGFPL
ncbi:MAG: DNA-3-methyladenine glycosylase 2 family protein [Pseudomonadota bacterium]